MEATFFDPSDNEMESAYAVALPGLNWGATSLAAFAFLLLLHALRSPVGIPISVVGGATPILSLLGLACGLVGLKADAEQRLARWGAGLSAFLVAFMLALPLVLWVLSKLGVGVG
jgi:hypothetical protein